MGVLARGEDLKLADGRTLHGPSYIGEPRSGRVIAISGDTAPCGNFASACSKADLIIHEATFCDEQAARAAKTRHSTARQAGQVAASAHAGELWLAHLSSRYAAGQRDADGLTYTDIERQAQAEAGLCTVRLTRDGMRAQLIDGKVVIEDRIQRAGPRNRGRRGK